MTFLIRYVHVGAAAFILGGALFVLALLWLRLRQSDPSPPLLTEVLMVYEWGFWLAAGLIVATGIGNLGAFHDSLPGPETEWGTKLTIKLTIAGILLAVSALRTISVYLVASAGPPPTRRQVGSLSNLYGVTAVFIVATLGFAVSLAHF
jgi:putative copper export protein